MSPQMMSAIWGLFLSSGCMSPHPKSRAMRNVTVLICLVFGVMVDCFWRQR